MDPVKKAAQDMMVSSQHIQEIFHGLSERLKLAMFRDLEVLLVGKVDFVPDLTKLTDQEETVVMTFSLELKWKEGAAQKNIDRYKERIDDIHTHRVFVGTMLTDGTFPVSFHKTISEIRSHEYFKQYQDNPDANPDNWVTKKAAKDIWAFLFHGDKPI